MSATALALDSIGNSYSGAARQRSIPNNSLRNRTQSFHSVAPSSHPQHATESRVETKAPYGNTFQERPIHKISERDLAKTVADALVVDFGDFSSKHKRIAKAAGAASEKSAENWTQGHNAPSLLYGLRLMAESPTLRKEIMRLCAMEAELSPEFQTEFAKFMQMVGR